ncbi:hypothetical protein [Kitasatospora sp. CB01950]|uniref:hypothetical protein n=1 Tax=Kitasatospora sp. CB01950 TaxID=1703930 RepID=UPI00093F01EC|nr:hypothetical protein [Kitasatospora sp. CB01950]OKJ10243.1 hypothetical protein AMK19_15285 [Kitasatospora sp. CB01950]
MSPASGKAVDRDALVLDGRLGQGGQGVVHRVANRRINRAAEDGGWEVVYKEYVPALLPELDAAVLTAMVDLRGELSADEGRWLFEKTAWPAAVVRAEGRVGGFLMRAAPDRFRFDFLSLGGAGATRRPANLEFLLNSDAYVTGIGLAVGDRDRLLLLADLAATLGRLHRIGIGVGDLSPKNLLFAAADPPECFLIDCDAMRLRGGSVLPQAETPDWQLPEGEEKATPAGDVHKLGLLAVRLIARDQTTTDPTALAVLSPGLGGLARRSLDADPARRPSPGEWEEHLRAVAPTVPVPVPLPVAASDDEGDDVLDEADDEPPKPSRIPRPVLAAALVVALLLLVFLVDRSLGGVRSAAPTATASRSSTPFPTPSPTPSPTPPPSPVRTTRTPSPAVTTPTFDPRSLDSAQTDRTPLSVAALLPGSFTDAKGVTYTRTSGGAQGCVDGTSGTASSVLRAADCDQQMVGTYSDSQGRVLVMVTVIPLADAQTAKDAYDALDDAYTTDWGLWCPKEGPGSEPCDGTDTAVRQAAQSGYRKQHHRYLMSSRALYVNLTTDSGAEEWTAAAAEAAVDEAGPQNYSGNR